MGRTTPLSPKQGMRAPVALLAGVIALSAIAGCIGMGDNGFGEPAVEAVLQVDRTERWSGEPFTFDGRGSTAAENATLLWRFELGDGTTYETDNHTRAIVHHAYETGGVYLVNLTVIATTDDGTNHTSTATTQVAVHARYEDGEEVLAAAPVPGAPIAASEKRFAVESGASAWEVDVHLASSQPLLENEVVVRVIGADNETITEERVTLGPEDDTIVRFQEMAPMIGTHQLNITVENGSVTLQTSVRVYYDADAQL
jgi:PKD repeat protein